MMKPLISIDGAKPVEMTDEQVASLVPESEILAVGVRSKRDALLATEVDPIVSNPLRWASMTAEQQQEWVDYRQALLDIPQQAGFPHDVVWPTKPEV